jgi:UDP-glucose 4-epimerase
VSVTGAGGFLGSAVVRAFIEAGHDVRAHRGAPGDPAFALPADVYAIDADITDEAALATVVRGTDACVHLAGPASVAASFAAPQTFARAHVEGTANVLRAASQANVARFVYVSSAEVYGRPACDPVSERAPILPRSPYGAAKAGAEASVGAAVRSGAIEAAVILRPFSIYGPGQRANSLLGTILHQVSHDDAVVLDDLRPERDYCFVGDVADAFVAACVSRIPGVTIANVGSGAGISVGELARAAVAAGGRAMPIRERGATRPPAAEIHRLVADVELAERLLGWRPAVSLADGLQRCFHVAGPT